MALKEQLQIDIKEAMRASDAFKLSTLRMAQAAMQSRALEERAKSGEAKDVELTDEQVSQVLKKEVKKRKDAAAEYEKGRRPELAEKELKEAAILEAYLPTEADDSAVEAAARAAIDEIGRDSKQFGKIMGLAMKKLAGTASGGRVSAAIKKLLD